MSCRGYIIDRASALWLPGETGQISGSTTCFMPGCLGTLCSERDAEDFKRGLVTYLCCNCEFAHQR